MSFDSSASFSDNEWNASLYCPFRIVFVDVDIVIYQIQK